MVDYFGQESSLGTQESAVFTTDTGSMAIVYGDPGGKSANYRLFYHL